MHEALNKTLASLPDDTKVYVSIRPERPRLGIPPPKHKLMSTMNQPGHEYTKSNVKFAMSVLQNDAIKRLSAFMQQNKESRGKFTIGDEKASFNDGSTKPGTTVKPLC
jgi:hydroxyacylglutathione hydrolase